MKVAPIIKQLEAKRKTNKSIELSWKLVHTGQHYDYEMSKVFFYDLEMSEPEYFLDAGSGSHAEQTAKVMIGFEKVCVKERPDIVMVVGDVNSTLACSITAKKLNIKVAHIEAGLRSRDMNMPEEINRIVTDSISDYLFVTEKSGIKNLKREGRKDGEIFFVGNVMIDTLFYYLDRLEGPMNSRKPKERIVKNGNYGIITLHRPSNVDYRDACVDIIGALIEISKDIILLFPVHPRTKKNLESFGLMAVIKRSRIKLMSPMSYMEFLKLWKDAELVFTDSGGIQEETTALGIPCFTIRDNTERPVTIEEGTNVLAGTTKVNVLSAYKNYKQCNTKKKQIPELWDGKAAGRIVEILTGPLK
ncbi:MAG: UDP-N-acetylglucosamine 2-epimerase (non-hydrolyzing) [Bacteriovoracaceae bacterium]|nr:UDP-N-acetylglucosamine 2-epimerase (non-hydrolyzing) [Bacteriovoracaceae bacterium]